MEKKFSSQIMQLRFMQRAVEKSKEPSSEQRAQIQERWVVEGAKDRCIVLMEGDPVMSCDGRLSFSNVRNENEGGNDGATMEINDRARELVEHKEPDLASGTENGAHDAQLDSKSNSSKGGKRNSERFDGKRSSSDMHGARFKKPPELNSMDTNAFSKRKPKRQKSR